MTDAAGPLAPPERRLPPVPQLAVTSMGLVIVAGIYLAAFLPKAAPLGPAIGLVATSTALTVANVVALSRIHPFAWDVFFRVGRWALLAYAVIAGMLEYVFLYDHTSGGALALLTVALVLFAVDVPTLFAFSVARFQSPTQSG